MGELGEMQAKIDRLETMADYYQERYYKLRDGVIQAIETLGNYADVLDGDQGQPRPNPAMSTMTELEHLLEEVKR